MPAFLVDIISPVLATALFWSTFGACVDPPAERTPPGPGRARLIASWNPWSCSDPKVAGDPHDSHRVIVELEDDMGARRGVSAPCELGRLMLDAPHYGVYRARIHPPQERANDAIPVTIKIAEPEVRWSFALARRR